MGGNCGEVSGRSEVFDFSEKRRPPLACKILFPPLNILTRKERGGNCGGISVRGEIYFSMFHIVEIPRLLPFFYFLSPFSLSPSLERRRTFAEKSARRSGRDGGQFRQDRF